MATESSAKPYPQVVKLDKALKLFVRIVFTAHAFCKLFIAVNSVEGNVQFSAEAWVDKMSPGTDDWNEPEFVGRPSRLGLGAKVRKHAEAVNSADPVERNLVRKFGVGKSKSTPKRDEQPNPSKIEDVSDEEDELESRSSVFSKRRPPPAAQTFQAKKKHK